jgi:hypothetical protein
MKSETLLLLVAGLIGINAYPNMTTPTKGIFTQLIAYNIPNTKFRDLWA